MYSGCEGPTRRSSRAGNDLAAPDVATTYALAQRPPRSCVSGQGRVEVDCQILRFNIERQAAYPLFQFDVTRQRVHPTIIELMKMRPDAWGGQMAFLHWLTRPNRSLGNARPCDRLEKDADAIVASFKAEISQPLHG